MLSETVSSTQQMTLSASVDDQMCAISPQAFLYLNTLFTTTIDVRCALKRDCSVIDYL
jgi:hypothetical protein